MKSSDFLETPPASHELTSYDEAHLVDYLRLLDAQSEGADWQDIARIVFGADSISDLETAKRQFDSHLARAKWLSSSGFVQI